MYHPVLYIAVAIKSAGNPDTHNPFFPVSYSMSQSVTYIASVIEG